MKNGKLIQKEALGLLIKFFFMIKNVLADRALGHIEPKLMECTSECSESTLWLYVV